MKKFLPLIILAILAMARGTCLAIDYDLWVGGIRVTSDNAANITGATIREGTVSFNPGQNILTLTDAHIYYLSPDDYDDAIKSEIDGLIIKLEGYSYVAAPDDGIQIGNNQNLTIFGPGFLQITSSYGIYGSLESNSTLRFDQGCSVVIFARGRGISYTGNVTVSRSQLWVEAETRNFCCHSLTLSNTHIYSPYGASFVSSQQCVCDSGGTAIENGRVVITPVLKVNGTLVTALNSYDVLGDGTVSYNFGSYQLTLNNAHIDHISSIGIESYVQDMRINLVGDNVINTTGSAGIRSMGDLSIEGTGSLNVTGSDGIYMNVGNLTIRGCTVSAYGTGTSNYSGFFGVSNYELTIDKAWVTANALSNNSPIYGFGALNLVGCEISRPEGAYYDLELRKMLAANGGTLNFEVYIAPTDYKIEVCGTRVTSVNADNVLGDRTVSYDEATNTLTLNNMDISNLGTNADGMRVENDGLIIKLLGTNHIRAYDDGIQLGAASITLQGPGSLNVESGYGIYALSANALGHSITIEKKGMVQLDCTYQGINYSNGTVVVDTASLWVRGGASSGAFNCGTVVTNGSTIAEPDGAYHNGTCICYSNGDPIYGSNFIKIEPAPYNLSVGGVVVTTANYPDILGNGTVAYDPVSNVLTLNGANINSEYPGIRNEIPDLHINLIGNNTITATPTVGVYTMEADLTIEGSGSLDVTALMAICSGGNLTLRHGCHVTATSTDTHSNTGALHGFMDCTLTLDGCYLVANTTSPNTSAIALFGAINLVGTAFNTPQSPVYNAPYLYYQNAVYCGTVIVRPMSYELTVAGVPVTGANAHDVLGDGKVRYDDGSQTLTLDNANIDARGLSTYGILNEIDGLTIQLIGDNYLRNDAPSYGAITTSNHDLFIVGHGQLDITSEGTGIVSSNCDLSIEGCRLYLTAMGNGKQCIYGWPTLDIVNSVVVAAAPNSTYTVIGGFNDINLLGCHYASPAGVSWDELNRRLIDGNGNVVTSVAIDVDQYDLWVEGVRVNSANAHDVKGDGTVRYNPSLKRLVLNNATLRGNAPYAINSEENGLRMELQGINHVSGLEGAIKCLNASLIIEGNGTLYAEGRRGINMQSSDLTIQGGSTVVATGTGGAPDNYLGAIVASGNSTMTVNFSTVRAFSPASLYGAIGGFHHLQLQNSYYYPADLEYNEYDYYVEHQGAVVEEVVIMPYAFPLLVAGNMVTAYNYTDITDPGIVGGTVSYDPLHNVLTLEHVNITNDNMAYGGIDNQIDGLTIRLVGVNNIANHATAHPGISTTNADLSIDGDGLLFISSVGSAIVASESDLAIMKGSTVCAYSDVNCTAILGVESDLLLDKCYIIARSGEEGEGVSAIYGFDHFTVLDCEIREPANGQWDYDLRCVAADGNCAGEVYIRPQSYNIWVANQEVCADNASHITGLGITGSVSYDAATNTLTLDNATINAESGILSRNNGLTIHLIGENHIDVAGHGIELQYSSLTITGPGSLSINAVYGIDCNQSGNNLTIQDQCIVTINASQNGIDVMGTLTVNTSVLKTYGGTASLACWNMALYSCILFDRDNMFFDDNQRAVCYYYNGNVVNHRYVNITPLLYVQNVMVDSGNCSDVLGDGKVNYNEGANTLFLDEAVIYAPGTPGIENHIPNLRIELEGINIVQGNYYGIYSPWADMVVEGQAGSQVTVQGGFGFYMPQSNLTIQGGCEVNAIATGGGYSSAIMSTSNFAPTQLTVVNSSVSASAPNCNFSGIAGFHYLDLEGCHVEMPENGSWEANYDNLFLMFDELGYIAPTVNIVPDSYDLTVGGIDVTTANCSDILGNGTAYYDPETNTLTLDNVSIVEPSNGIGILNRNDGLTIVLKNANYIYVPEQLSGPGKGLKMESAITTTITGQGSLSIVAANGIVGYYYGSTLNIEDGPRVYVTADYHGINMGYGTLSVKNAMVDVMLNDPTVPAAEGVLCAGYFTMEGCSITIPSTATWTFYDGNPVYLKDGNRVVKDEVRISPEEYRLYVKGITVTSANAFDVLDDGGSVVFDADYNQLFLDCADIFNQTGYGISSSLPSLTIELIGVSHVKGYQAGILVNDYCDLTIEGNWGGALYVEGDDGIYMRYGDLTIQGGCTVESKSITSNLSYSAFYGSSSHNFIIHNSTVVARKEDASGGSYAGYPIANFEPQLIGCAITTPSVAVWDNGHYVDGNGDDVEGLIVITPKYLNLWVGGTQVTTGTSSDIFLDGTTRYDTDNNILYLEDANIVNISNGGPDNSDGIYHRIDGLTINLTGRNYLQGSDDGINFDNLNTTITGTGLLNIRAGYGIYSIGGKLTLDGASLVSINAPYQVMNLGETGVLNIDDASLYCTGSNIPIRARYINLNWADIVTPVNGSVYDSGMSNGSFIVDANDSYEIDEVSIVAYNVFNGNVNGSWDEAGNWSFGTVPVDDYLVGIDAECVFNMSADISKLVVSDNGKLTLQGSSHLIVNDIFNDDWDKLIIEDGAHLIHFNNGVAATVKKNISGYGNGNGGYYLLSQPFSNGVDIDYDAQYGGTNLAVGNYDLYLYREYAAYWINYKELNANNERQFSTLDFARGYLYANRDNITLTMKNADQMGLNNCISDVALGMGHQGTILNGFNLVGNPWLCDAYLLAYNGHDLNSMDRYVLNDYGTELIAADVTDPLPPLEAAFVEYEEDYPYVALINEFDNAYLRGMTPSPSFNLSVSKDEEDAKVLNNVILHNGEGRNMNKLMLDESNTSLSVVSEGKEYGSFYYEGEATLTLRFKAAEQGRYVISLSGAQGAIVLRDTLTGTVTDLSQDSYSFEASPTDSADRFEVVVK